MTFEELGTALRTEREKRGVSIDDVATHLKISGRIIRALEEGDMSSLPHTVYVRGFIRSYGTYLGLSGEELAEAMDTVASEELPVNPHSVYTPVDAAAPSSGKILCTLALLGCLAGLGAVWYYRDADLFSDEDGRGVIPATAQPAPPVMPPPSISSASSDGAVVPAVPLQEPATFPAAQLPQVSLDNMPPPSPTPAGPSSIPPQHPDAATQQQKETSEQHKIIITALAECWIHSNADDTDTRQFSLRKGDTFALAFSKKLTLKLGNAGGVRIRYDGQDLPAPGGDGQVRTLTFPPVPQ